jgi:glycerol uptake facilitator protein
MNWSFHDNASSYPLVRISAAFIFGEASGASFNPARDLGPRVAHAVLPIKGKGDNDWSYGLTVPVIGPIIGAIIAVLLYNVIF